MCKNDDCKCGNTCEKQEITGLNIVEIENENGTVHCMLDHSGDPRGPGPYPAKATMVLKFNEGNIPFHICDVCSISLLDKHSEWYLFICFGCMETKWLHYTDVKQTLKGQIQGMNTCPDCENAVIN